MRSLWQSLHAKLMLALEPMTTKTRFDAVRAAAPELRRFVDPAAVLDHLHGSGGDRDDKDRVLAALAGVAREPVPVATWR